jgi:hypothetical protein
MKATYMFGAGDVRVVDAPDPALQDPTDAVVRIVRACVCGSDLHPYHSMETTTDGVSMGHEFIGVIEEIGADVRTLARGDMVISPFAFSDGTCEFCRPLPLGQQGRAAPDQPADGLGDLLFAHDTPKRHRVGRRGRVPGGNVYGVHPGADKQVPAAGPRRRGRCARLPRPGDGGHECARRPKSHEGGG